MAEAIARAVYPAGPRKVRSGRRPDPRQKVDESARHAGVHGERGGAGAGGCCSAVANAEARRRKRESGLIDRWW